MRKFLIILLFSASVSIGGEFSSRGMKIGLNSARFVGKDLPGKNISSMPGFSIGGFFSYQFTEFLSIQPEFAFTTKGSKINTIGDYYLSNLFAYFEFPVLAKIFILPKSKVKPHFICGPALAFNYFALNDTGLLEDIRGTDLGLILGAGIEYWKISLDIRINQGIVDFDTSVESGNLKNRVFSFMVGYLF